MDANDWFLARCAEHPDGICYYLQDAETADSLRFLFQGISEIELEHERQHAEKYSRYNTLGHSPNYEFVAHPLKISRPASGRSVERFQALEMEPSFVQSVATINFDGVEKLAEGHWAANGRFIVNSNFLREMERIRLAWGALPKSSRPLFPMNIRSLRTLGGSPSNRFISQFQSFARRWRIQQILMWHLVDLDPVFLVPKKDLHVMYKSLRASPELPTAFSLSSVAPHSRGKIYRDHRARSEADGIYDHNYIQTYIAFMRIHHWQRVLDLRYPTLERPRDFVTRRNFLIAELCGLSGDRIKKLMNRMAQFRAGSLSTLKGMR